MKKIFFFFYSLISITITPQALKNDWENDELKGKVSKITIIYQFPQVSEGEIIPQNYNSGFFSKQYETLYNKQGKKIEKNIYDSDGILQNKESYYNNEENLNIPIPPPQNKVSRLELHEYAIKGTRCMLDIAQMQHDNVVHMSTNKSKMEQAYEW